MFFPLLDLDYLLLEPVPPLSMGRFAPPTLASMARDITSPWPRPHSYAHLLGMVIIWNAVLHTAAAIQGPGPFQAYRTDILTAVLNTISTALTPIIVVPMIPGRDSRPAYLPSQCLLISAASLSSASCVGSLRLFLLLIFACPFSQGQALPSLSSLGHLYGGALAMVLDHCMVAFRGIRRTTFFLFSTEAGFSSCTSQELPTSGSPDSAAPRTHLFPGASPVSLACTWCGFGVLP